MSQNSSFWAPRGRTAHARRGGGGSGGFGPHLGQLGDLLAHLQVQVLGVLHGHAGLEGHGAGSGGRGAELARSGGAVVLLPARPGRHLPRRRAGRYLLQLGPNRDGTGTEPRPPLLLLDGK